jgi:hypothetical protein
MSRENETKQVKVDITFEQFKDVIITALEGGSNYWYTINSIDIPPKYVGCGSRVDRIAEKLWDDPEYKLPIYDVEDDSEQLGELSMQGFLDNAVKDIWAFNEMLNGEFDANTADILFQLAIMGEIVYG